MNTTIAPTIARHLFCPVCGEPMKTIVQQWPHKPTEPLFLHTCFNRNCKVYGRTCSNSTVADPVVLAQWEAVQMFSIDTGEVELS